MIELKEQYQTRCKKRGIVGTIKNIVEVKGNGNTSRRYLERESKTVDFLITCIPQNSSLPSPYED
jgi:hypothetical protein